MDLSIASSFFDADEILDGYTGAYLFTAHSTPHDDTTSSGSTVRRKTLVTQPDARVPARRVISFNGETWIVGNNNPDSFQGSVIRRNFGLKKSSGLFELLTPGQAAADAPGRAMHAQRDYFRDTTDTQTSSDWDTMWSVYCPFNEPVKKGMYLQLGSSLMRIRNLYPSVDEFLVAEADELDADARQRIEFIKKAKVNLVAGTQDGESVFVDALQFEIPKSYSFRVEAEASTTAGDRSVVIPMGDYTPATGAVFLMQGVQWRVMTAVPLQDAWSLHVRRV